METYKIETPRGMFNIRDRGNKDGFPVVMVHGWPESSYCWEGVSGHLDPEWRIVAPDLRGLGESERTLDVNAYQKKELAKDVAEVLKLLEIEKFFLVGHDWGGVVAQETALLLKDQVKKLVLMNIPVISNKKGRDAAAKVINSLGGIHNWYRHFMQMPNLPEGMIRGKEHVWIPFFYGRAVADGTISREMVEEYVRCYSIEHTPATAAALYRTLPEDEKRWDGLSGKKFTMPALYIYGKNDPVIIPQYLDDIEKCFESLTIEYLEAGHFVQEEKAREVAELMNRFFADG